TLFTLSMATSVFASQIDFRSLEKEGKTNFEAVGKPAMIKIKGESPAPKATLTFKDGVTSLEADLSLEGLKTGIDMRDDHMKEKYLETKKYPNARLVIKSLNIPAEWEKTPSKIAEQKFVGTLTLHGKDSLVEGTFSLSEKKEASAEFKIKLSDHNIEIPEYMGIKVAELVTVKTQIQFERQ
ncbi:MAG: YceI family protein, partial [Bdellovibrionales bacterium]|nr:YceI family protein [Bdellovibrionales bacterium]